MQPTELLLLPDPGPAALLERLRTSPASGRILDYLREAVPELQPVCQDIPQTTYTLYRQYVRTGERSAYESRYFEKRSMLTRAVVEVIFGEEDFIDLVQDLLWSICEETSWVLPAHEDVGDGFESLGNRGGWPGGMASSLTRAPDFIDLFAAETSASLAEAIYLLEDRLAPEVVQRVRQEVDRRIFRPYLAYGRKYWWHRGDLNWNAVCNGAVGLAFMRLERDPRRLAEGLVIALEGFDAYIQTGFEADGGSLEGIAYWNYGLLYYVTLADLLDERTAGQIDLLAGKRIQDIAHYPLAIALAPGKYFNFADAAEEAALQPGITQRLAARCRIHDLMGLIVPHEMKDWRGFSASKLAIVLRDLAWWDGQYHPFPEAAGQDAFLPACAVIKLCGQTTQGTPVILAAKAGFNSGHHYHLDIGHFIVNVGGENLLCDPGRGLYQRGYFGEQRFHNIFCNSFGHSLPVIQGRLEMPGPKFGNGRLAQGQIVDHGTVGSQKYVVIEFHQVYDLPELHLARRTLRMDANTGEICLEDQFEFGGSPFAIEEAFVTWRPVYVDGPTARVAGQNYELSFEIEEPPGVSFIAHSLAEECQANLRDQVLTRLSVRLPVGMQRFIMHIVPTNIAQS